MIRIEPASGSSRVVRRKNGTIPSCEPCRKRKARCDHGKPICDRCIQRGEQTQCIYHPAPMSKKSFRGPLSPAAGVEAVGPRWRAPVFRNATTPGESEGADKVITSQADDETHDWYTSRDGRVYADHVKALTEVLAYMTEASPLQRLVGLVETYFPMSMAMVTPEALFMPAVHAVADMLAAEHVGRGVENRQMLAEKILAATTKPVTITADTTAEEFMHAFTGDDLRLEFVAVVFSLAGASALNAIDEVDKHRELAFNLVWCSTTCLRICREIAKPNDMLLIAAQEHLHTVAVTHGYTSDECSRILGDACSDIELFGLYCDDLIRKNTPFFLAEQRRRVYGKIYQADKAIAALVHRPPRLLSRYATVSLPLDLSDEDMLAPLDQRERAVAALTPDGWNAEGVFQTTTWVRLRILAGRMLEKSFEHRFQAKRDADTIAKVKELSKQSWAAWEALPDHLHYNDKTWSSGIKPGICLLLSSTYLIFLQCDFQAFLAVAEVDLECKQRLFKAAADILFTIQELRAVRRRADYINQGFPYSATYGIEAAVFLARCLADLDTIALPAGLDRAKLVRALAVFVSDLDSVTSKSDPNYDVCTRGRTRISQTLDETLNGPQLQASMITPLVTTTTATTMDAWDAAATPGDSAWAQTSAMDWTALYGTDSWSYM